MSIAGEQRLAFEPLREDQFEAILAIEGEAYPEPWSRGMFKDELKSPRSYFRTVYLAGQLIGYGGFWLVLDEAHITSVTIGNRYRKRGYGRDLMMHLLDAAYVKGVRQATLEVRQSNSAARQLYESLGFTQVGVRKGYYSSTGEDALVMLKEL